MAINLVIIACDQQGLGDEFAISRNTLFSPKNMVEQGNPAHLTSPKKLQPQTHLVQGNSTSSR